MAFAATPDPRDLARLLRESPHMPAGHRFMTLITHRSAIAFKNNLDRGHWGTSPDQCSMPLHCIPQ